MRVVCMDDHDESSAQFNQQLRDLLDVGACAVGRFALAAMKRAAQWLLTKFGCRVQIAA